MKANPIRVKELRLNKSWTQELLAEFSNMSVRTIQRVEQGKNISVETIKLIASALDVEPDRLILKFENEKGVTPLTSVKNTLINYFDFSGVATRREYWYFFVFMLLVLAIMSIVHQTLLYIFSIVLLIPFLAVGTRRLNDIGMSGWWQLLYIVPFGQFLLFYFFTLPIKE